MDKDYTSRIKQLRNLAMFKNKSDDEIIEFLKNREARESREKAESPELPISTDEIGSTSSSTSPDHSRKFKIRFTALQKEYGVDMNNSNDVEMLKTLARHLIQAEIVDQQILRLQSQDEIDTRTLKNLGDYQRTVQTTISDLQDKLNITRKQRKEKQVDDIPQYIEGLRQKALNLWNRKTVAVRCEKCEIELARYWLNFPEMASIINFQIECWKCKEKVVFSR